MIGVRHRNGRVVHGVGLQRAPGKNYLRYSQTLANSVWAKYGSAVVGAKVLAPDGTMTADSITGGNSAFLFQGGLEPYWYVGSLFVASVWYRAAVSNATLYIEVSDLFDGNPYNTIKCNVTTTWQRFSLGGTIASGFKTFGIWLGSRFGTFPTNQAIEMWGAQLVLGTSTLRKYVATEGVIAK